MRRDEGAGGQPRCVYSAPGIEAEPTYPKQAGTDEAEDQIVRLHWLTWKADALAEIERAYQRADARSDVDHRTACKIETGHPAPEKCVQEAAFAPHHMSHREVHDSGPKACEQQH